MIKFNLDRLLFEKGNMKIPKLQEMSRVNKNTLYGPWRRDFTFLRSFRERGISAHHYFFKRVLPGLPRAVGLASPGISPDMMSESTRHLLATLPRAPKRKSEIIPVLEERVYKAFVE